MRATLAALLAWCVLIESVLPALASEPAVGGPEPQAPDIQPFKSAHFGLAGAVKLDGVTIDVLGEGDIAPPDRQRSAFKFGPLTAEVIVIGDAVYTRTRFDRRWSRQLPLSRWWSVRSARPRRRDNSETSNWSAASRFGA